MLSTWVFRDHLWSAAKGLQLRIFLGICRYPPTDEVFFVQNAGAKDAGTGLNKSNIIQKISLAQAAAVSTKRNASGSVDVVTVKANPTVINSNGRSGPAMSTVSYGSGGWLIG